MHFQTNTNRKKTKIIKKKHSIFLIQPPSNYLPVTGFYEAVIDHSVRLSSPPHRVCQRRSSGGRREAHGFMPAGPGVRVRLKKLADTTSIRAQVILYQILRYDQFYGMSWASKFSPNFNKINIFGIKTFLFPSSFNLS